MKEIEVVAAIIQDGCKFLATQRGNGEFQGLWEFPGGKVEPAEEIQAALIREIQEELEVQIEVDRFLTTVSYTYPTFQLTMHCFLCRITAGTLNLTEHLSAQWLDLSELKGMNWLPADIAVVEKILHTFQCA